MKDNNRTQPPPIDPRYPFATIHKDKDAVVMGIVPANKYQHAIYTYIKKSSTTLNASQGKLFFIREMQVEKLKIKREEVTEIIQHLHTSKLIAQMVCFDYDPYQRKLRAKSVFVTHPAPDRSENIFNIFEELNNFSVETIKSWLDGRDAIKVDSFRRFLDRQFNFPRLDEYYEYTGTVLHFRKELMDRTFEIPIQQELIDTTYQEITRKTLQSKIGIELPDECVLLLKDSEMIEYFEACNQFMMEKVVPTFRSNPKFKAALEKINMDEVSYKIDPFAHLTGKFVIKRAKEIKKFKLEGGSDHSYPGSFCIAAVINLESLIEKKYSEKWTENCKKLKDEFKGNLMNQLLPTHQLIRFVDESEVQTFPPEVWRELTNDLDLYHTKWEMKTYTLNIFAARNINILRNLIFELLKIERTDEMWKLSAFKTMIEENKDSLVDLFEDKYFVINYEELSKRVYLEFIPWYIRLFLSVIPMSVLKDKFFEQAKQKIVQTQENYRKQNEQRQRESHSKKEIEKKEKLSSMLENTIAGTIVDILDHILFSEKDVPDLDLLKVYFTEMDDGTLKATLSKNGFRLIPYRDKEHDITMVLHPANTEWIRKRIKVLKILEQIIHDLTKEFVMEHDKLTIAKANKMKVYIESNQNIEPSKPKKGGQTDPYIRLDRRIKNLNEKENQLQIPLDDH